MMHSELLGFWLFLLAIAKVLALTGLGEGLILILFLEAIYDTGRASRGT